MALTAASAHRKDITTGMVRMEHRHFATIATIIRELDRSLGEEEIKLVAEHFADELASTNGNFNRKRFLAACGVGTI